MYDQSKLSELTRFARVDAGSIVIEVYPGDSDWTRLFLSRHLRRLAMAPSNSLAPREIRARPRSAGRATYD